MSNSSRRLRAYLDTCIASGLAKRDLAEGQLLALDQILHAADVGMAELSTSQVMREELRKIPEAHRSPHIAIYERLLKVPLLPQYTPVSRFHPGQLLAAVWQEEPRFSELRALLRDAPDADHAWQASQNEIPFLITVDRSTFLKHKEAIERICGLRLVQPNEFLAELALGMSSTLQRRSDQ